MKRAKNISTRAAKSASVVRARKPRPLGVSLASYSSVFAMAGALVAGASSASAATYYWDLDTNAANNVLNPAGTGLGGAGAWDTALKFWAPFAGADIAWPNSTDTVVFSGTAGAVTLSQPTNAGELLFNTTGYSITGNTLTLAGSATNPGVITLGSNIGAATITSVLAGGNGLVFNGNGSGSLNLNGAVLNTNTGGTTLNSGQIIILSGTSATGNSLGAAGNAITFGGTAITRFDNGAITANKTWANGALSFNGGDGTVTTVRTAAFNTVNSFTSLAPRVTGATGAFVLNGTIGTNQNVTIAGQANGFMGPGYFESASSAGPYAYAFYDTSLNSVRGLNYAVDTTAAGNAATTGTAATLGAGNTGKNVQATGNITAQTTQAFNTIDLSTGANLALAAGATLTTQGILKNSGGASITISGGAGSGITAGGGNELIIRTDTAANDNITITTPILATTGALTKSGLGTLTLTAANAYTGTTYVNAGTLVAQGAGALGASTAIKLSGGFAENAASATVLSLQNDGDSTGSTQNISYGQNTTVVGNASIIIGKLAAAQALNKTIQLGTLTLGEDTLNVTNNNGYGLEFTGAVSLTGATNSTFNLATATASNVVQSLLLSNVVSSNNAVGLTKQGVGTMVLGNSGNTFGGANALIDIQGGVLQANSDGSLGDSANVLDLDGGAIRFNYSTASSARSVYLGASSSIEVTSGNSVNLANGFTVPVNANTLTKTGNGTLILGAASPGTWTGGATVNAGILQLTGPNALGAGIAPVTVASVSGAAVQLTGGFSYANPIQLSPTANVIPGGVNAGGQLENFSGSNTTTGVITQAFDAEIGADAGTTLNINGGIFGNFGGAAHQLWFTVGTGGAINVASGITSNTTTANQFFGLQKYGAGALNFTTALLVIPTTLVNLNGGTTTFSSAGSLTGGPTITAALIDSSLVLDNSGTAVSSRLGTSRPLTLSASGLTLIGNASTAVTESLGAVTSIWGGNTIEVDPAAANTTLTGASLTINGASTLTFKSGPTGAGAAFGASASPSVNNIIFTAAPTLNSPTVGIIPRAIVLDANGINFATYNNSGTASNAFGLQALTNYNIPTISSVTTAGSGTITVADSSVFTVGQAVYGPNIPAGEFVTGAPTATTITITTGTGVAAGTANLVYGTTADTNINAFDALRSVGENIKVGTGFITNGNVINSVTRTFGSVNLFGPGQTFDAGSSGVAGTGGSSTYNITSGNILSQGTGGTATNTIGNGAIIAVGGTELGLNIASGNTLAVNGVFTSTGNVTKGLDGNLTFNTKQYFGTAAASNFTLNGAGTTTLNGGNNTLYPGVPGVAGQSLAVGPGAILDLNGTAQTVGSLLSPNNNAFSGSGGTVTSLSGAGTLVDAGSVLGIFGGQITGNVSFAKAGNTAFTAYNDNNFTGSLLLMGNTTKLIDSGKFSGATSIDVNSATLTVDDSGLLNDNNRFGAAVPITLRSGSLQLTGRVQTVSSVSYGALTLAQGTSQITATAGGTGINSADIIFSSFNAAGSKDGTVNFNTSGVLGGGGHIIFTTPPAVTNKLVSPQFEVGATDFASYVAGSGLVQLGSTGAPAYDGVVLPLTSNVPTQNLKVATAGTLPATGSNINSLNITAVNVSFAGGTDVLNLTSGGLMHTGASSFLGASVDSGFLTAGGATPSGTVPLYVYTQNTGATFTINSRIVDNGASPLRLVLNTFGGNGIIALTDGLNSYTGGTVVNGWNGGAGTINLAGAAGAVVVPAGGISINYAVVTEVTNGGQINPANTVTLNGSSTLTLVGTNTLTGLAFNNSGGVTAPAVATGGTLFLTGATPITETGSNPSTIAAVSGTLDFANVAKTISVDPTLVNGQSVAPLTTQLNISALIQNSGLITKTGNGNLQLSATTSTFTGGVNLSAGGLVVGGSSNNQTVGGTNNIAVTSGPLGTGALTIAAGTTLLSSAAANSIGNALNIGGSFTFDGLNNLTLLGNSALPASNTAITVNAPQMTATLGGNLTGTGSSITKNGFGVLALSGNYNTFDSGVTLNAGTLLATGTSPFGSGTISINGGLLQLKNNSSVNYGNNVTLASGLADAFIDINNNGLFTGNTFTFGTLTSQPTTTLNVSGGNGYRVAFTSTNLATAYPATATNFNPALGVGIILPGGFSDANRPVNIGQGSLILSGTNTFSTTPAITGTQIVAPQANAVSQPFGNNATVLTNGSTLQITPLANTLSSTGYTPGGVTGHFSVFAAAPALNVATANGLVAAGTVGGIGLGDSNMSNHPAIVVGSGAQVVQDLETYTGLLNITAGGSYTFGLNKDDQAEIVVDGMTIHLGDGVGGTPGGNAATYTYGTVNLTSGLHSVTVRHNNGTGGSDVAVVYSGGDTAGAPGSHFQTVNLSNLYYNVNGVATAANGYLNAAQINTGISLADGVASTVDLASSDYNTTYNALALGSSTGGANLTVTNTLGSGFFGITGATTVTGAGNVLNPTTGYLYLIGGVADSGSGLTKTGGGTLILGASGTGFTGALNVKNGFLQLAAPTALTTGTTTLGDTSVAQTGATLDINGQTLTGTGIIVLNGAGVNLKNSATPAGITNSILTAGTISQAVQIGAAITGSGGGANTPAIGGFGNITISGVVSDNVAGQAWNKVGPDVLTLSNATNTFTGLLTVSAGQLQLGSAGALGTSVANGVVVSSGADLDLNGQTLTVLKPLSLTGIGLTNFNVPNTLGALINSSSTAAAYAGPITLAGATSIGGPSLLTGVNGGITLSGTIAGAQQITKVGVNSLTLTGAAGAETFIDTQDGTTTISGSGTQTSQSQANIIRPGATFTLDNSGTAVSNRTGNRGLYMNGAYNIIGNATTQVSEVINQGGNNIAVGTANGVGQSVLTLTNNGANLFVQVNSTSTQLFARGVGSSALFRGTNLGLAAAAANGSNIFGGGATVGYSAGTTPSFQIIGQLGTFGLANTGIYQWAVADTSATGVGTSFATYSNTNGVETLSSSGGFVATAPVLTTTNANVTNASAAITVANTAGLSAGMAVQGVGIAAGTTIASIAGNVVTLSANATATSNNTLTFSTGAIAYPNVIATGAITAGSATAAQLLNSVTLSGTGANLAITSGLQLDSGGVLAVGNADNVTPTAYTISGGMLTGGNTLNREMIFHVTGAANTLTVSAPIYSNTGGLTKADGGTLILGTAEPYIGNTSVNAGTLQLNGGNNTLASVYAIPSATGGSTAAISGQALLVNNGGTLDLNGTMQAVNVLNTGNAAVLQGGSIINSNATASTFHIAPNNNFTWSGDIGGTTNSATGVATASPGAVNFSRDGNSTFTVNSPNALTGSVTLTGGATTLVDLGTFQNETGLTVNRATLILNDEGVQAVTGRLSATAPVTLAGGAIQWLGRSNTESSMSLGAVTLGAGSSLIQLNNLNGGLTLTLASLTHIVGSAINFNSLPAGSQAAPNGGGIGEANQVMITTPPAAVNGILPAWITVQQVDAGGNFQVVEPGFAFQTANGLQSINPTLTTVSTGFVPTGVNARVTTNLTLPTGGATLNTVSILNPGATTISFINANDLLTVTSGGIIGGLDNQNRAIGTTALPGQITAGVGQQELFFHVGAANLAINSKIIDNGAPLNVIYDSLSQSAPSVSLTNANTYTGTTYINGIGVNLNSAVGPAIPGNLILSGGNNNATDSLAFNTVTLNFQQTNQLASTANVTMNGATQIYLGQTVPTAQAFSNTQTINNLTFNNDGGSNGANGPTIFTGAGTLTITGTINSANNLETFTIPTMNGFINLTTGAINVDANAFVPNQIGLALNSNIVATAGVTKTGTGFLGIGGQSQNLTSAFALNGGGLAFSATGAIIGSPVTMAANTTIDARGLTGTVGSIASTATTAQVINGLQGTAGTVQAGLDNTNTSFAGVFGSPYPTGLLNVTKVGTGTFTLTGDSTVFNSLPNNDGTLLINSGGVTFSGASGRDGFTTTNIGVGGTLTLDNSVTAANNRLGGATLATTAAILAPTLRILNMNGGNLNIGGNSSTVVNEAIGSNANITGGGIITLNSTGTAGINLVLSSLGGQNNQSSLLIRGDGLGATIGTNNAGAGVATVTFANAAAPTVLPPGLGFNGGQSAGANGTAIRSIRPDIIVDSSATGTGTGFLTIDSVTGLVRPLGNVASGELTASFGVANNVGLSTATTSNASIQANSLTLLSGGSLSLSLINGNPFGAAGLLNVDVNHTGGLLSLASASLSAGQYQSAASQTLDFQIPGTSANVFTLNAPINSQNGFVKAGGGTLVLNQPYFTNGAAPNTVSINGGTLQLGAGVGANSFGGNVLDIWSQATIPLASGLSIQNGTLDLNGNNQLLGNIVTTNPLPFDGGTVASPNSVITNSSATPVVLSINGSGTVVSTVISGAISLDKSGNVTTTLSSPQTYTGSTTIRGGALALRDSGTLTVTSAINANYATLQLDNTGLSNIPNRIATSIPINLTGGAIQYNATSAVSTTNVGTVNLNGGSNVIFANQYNNNGQTSSLTFNISNLALSNNSTINFEAQNLGGFTGAQTHIYLTQVNGTPFSAASLANGIIGAPYLVSNNGNSFGWASYANAGGVVFPNTLGSPNYGALGGGAATNANVGSNAISVAGQTLNTIASIGPAATTTIGLNGTQDQLVLAGGGILIQDSGSKGVTFQGGSITSGVVNTPSSLYLHVVTTTGTASTFNSPIVNNGTGAVTLVRDGGAPVTFTPNIVESVVLPNTAVTTLTVPNSTGLYVGMPITANNVNATANASGIPAGDYISAITGGPVNATITLSAAITLSGTPTASTQQLTFGPAVSSATSTTTSGTNSVTTAANAFSGSFLPTIGQTIGGPNIPGGTTITGVSGTNATGFTLTLSQNAIATGAANAVLTVGTISNTFTGGTIINAAATGGTYAGGTTNLSGLPGSIVIPGNLSISGGATVTEVTNQGQIAPTSNLTINGTGTLNLVGTNTLNSVTFSSTGGNATPTVAVGTQLNLSSTGTGASSAIFAQNDNTAFTPTINGTTVNFPGAATISASGLSVDDLIINAQITAGGTITKAGAGSLILPNANAAALNWNLAAGTLILQNNNALGATVGSTLTITGNGTIMAGSANLTAVPTPVTFNAGGNLTFGGNIANNSLTWSGAVNLNGAAPTIATSSPIAMSVYDTISGPISGAGGFTSSGPGTLIISGTNNFTGPVNITGGRLQIGASSAISASNAVVVSTPGEFDINSQNVTVGSLAGPTTTTGGIVTNSGATAVTLTTGGDNSSTTFAGIITAATPANLALTKVGSGTMTLANSNQYTGATTVNAGTLTLGSGGKLAASAVAVNNGGTFGSTPGVTSAINSIGSSLTLNSGGNFTMLDGTINTLNVAGTGSLGAGPAGSNLSFDINGNTLTSDLLAFTGAVTANVGADRIYLNNIGTALATGNSFTVITGASGLGTNKFTLGTTKLTSGGVTYTLSLSTSTAGAEIVTVGAAGTDAAYYTGARGSAWNSTAGAGTTNFSSSISGSPDLGVQPGATTDVFFTATGATNLNNTLGQDYTINSLNFNNQVGSVTIGGTNTLTLLGSNAINVASGAPAETVNTAVVFGNATTLTNSATSPLTIGGAVNNGGFLVTTATTTGGGNIVLNGTLSGAGGLTVGGTGTTIISGTNTFTGATANGGTLQLTSAGALATSALALLNNSTLQLRNDANTTFNDASLTTPAAGVTLNIDVNNNGSAVTGKTLGLANTLTFANNTNNQINVTGGNGYSLTLSGLANPSTSGGPYTTTLNATTAGLTLNTFTTGNFGSTLTLQGGNTITLNALVLSSNGSDAINVSGAGTVVTLAGATTSTGGRTGGTNVYTLNSGTLNINTATAVANTSSPTAASLVIAGGTLNNTSGAPITETGNPTQTWNGDFTFTGTQSLNLGTGAVTLGASRTVTVNNNTLSVGGIAGTGFNLTKAGAGTLAITGASPFTGTTNVNAGQLTVSGAGTLAGTTGLSVATGAQFNYLPTVPATTLTLGTGSTLTFANNATVGETFGSTIAAAGAATMGANLNLVPSGTFVSGTQYTLLTAASGFSTTASNYSVLNPTNYTYSLTLAGGSVKITPTAATALTAEYWLGGLASNPGVWAASDGSTASNFASSVTGTATPLVPGATANVFFSATGATNQASMSLGADMAVNSITVNGGGANGTETNPLVLAGGNNTLTIGSTTTPGINIAAGAGAVTLNPNIVVGIAESFTNNSSNTLTFGGQVNTNALLLTVAGSGNTTFAGPIVGIAGILLNSTGTVNYTGATTASYSNTTSLNQGTLALGANQTFLSGFNFGTTTSSGTGTNNVASTLTSALNLNAASATVNGLTTVLANTATANTITIGAGQSLNLAGGLMLGIDSSLAASLITTNARLTVSGAGSLNVNTSFDLGKNQVTFNANNNSIGTLDLSGLTGGFTAGVTNFDVGFGFDTAGVLVLSNTSNIITATTLNVGNSNGNNGAGVPSTLTFGTGTNVVHADTINIGFSKEAATAAFASQAAASPGTLTITNTSGTGGANINIGSHNGTGTATILTGTLDLRGHNSTVAANIVTIGNSNNAGGAGSASGVLSFDTGTFAANTLNLGLKSAAGTASNTAALNLGGGTFTVAGVTTGAADSENTNSAGNITSTLTQTAGSFTTGSLNLGSNSSTTTTGPGTATTNINISGGTFTTGSVTGAAKTSVGTGVAAASINVSGGTFLVTPGSTFSLASQAGAGTASGALNVSGTGVANINADITDGGGAATTTVSLNGGTLDLFGHAIGTVNPIDVLTLQTGTLRNVASINATGANGGVIKNTTGTLILGGTNTYTGDTAITNGTVQLASANGVPTGTGSGNVVLNGGATAGILDINGNNATINGLSGTTGGTLGRVVNNASGANTLTVGAGNNTATYAGIIADNNNAGTGTLGITKAGTGSETLSGANTYTGTTTISGGSLIAGAAVPSGAASPFGNSSSAIVLGDANSTTNNSSPTLVNNGFNIGRAVNIANFGGTGTPILSSNVDTNSSFSGAITAARSFSITQAANTGTNALSITGGITSSAASGNQTATFTGPGNTTVSGGAIADGVNGGHIGVTVSGGTTTLAVPNNSYTGPTNVTGGNLVISGSITGATQVTLTGGNINVTSTGGLATMYSGAGAAVNVTGGTLLLSSDGAVANAPSINLGGGTLSLGASAGQEKETFGNLTLSANSIIDFGAVAAGGTLAFSNIDLSGGVLKVYDWTGSTNYSAGNNDTGTFGDGQDRLLFSGTVTGDVTSVRFYSDAGITPVNGSSNQITFSGSPGNEIVPVPEPTSTALLGAAGLLGLIGYRERARRRAKKAASLTVAV